MKITAFQNTENNNQQPIGSGNGNISSFFASKDLTDVLNPPPVHQLFNGGMNRSLSHHGTNSWAHGPNPMDENARNAINVTGMNQT
jgi:hypothetical protein